MRILIDTNILIKREENVIVTEDLQELLKLLDTLNHKLLVHPLSIEEIEKDKDHKRKIINLSKIGTYLILEHPPLLDENDFLKKLNKKHLNENERVDYNLVYCVYRNAVHLLITEDMGIIRNAKKLGLSDRILTINDALKKFKKELLPSKIKLATTPAIKQTPIYNLDLSDPFFDSLKTSYPEFLTWWEKISKEGRMAWAYFKEEKLGALLIYKNENEAIHSNPPLPKKLRVKISTLKVTYTGFRMGELLIKLAIQFAVECNIDELYLTHFTTEDDNLLNLIERYGFRKKAVNKRGEDIFIKRIIADERCEKPLDIQKLFYPSFFDGKDVKKFIVPIQPDFHDRLFTDYDKRQPKLYEFDGELIVPGNAIKKAYICHSNTKIILLYFNFHLPKSIPLIELQRRNIITGYLQSIREITHENYIEIRKLSNFNTNYCVESLKII